MLRGFEAADTLLSVPCRKVLNGKMQKVICLIDFGFILQTPPCAERSFRGSSTFDVSISF